MNTRRITALAAAGALTLGLLSACHDSEQDAQLNVNYVEFDANEAVAPYLENLPEIPEADKDFVVEMGFFDCDHMVGAIIGQKSGIYEALGLNVNVTKSGQAMNALIAGDMDCAYVSFQSAINNFNAGAPLIGLVGSHLGGARYFLVRDEITSLDQIKSLTVTETSMESTEWLRFSSELGMDPDYRSYEGVSMSNSDAVTALKADQIDGCFVWDPYASRAEEEGYGKVINTAWGSLSNELGIGWGVCCTEVYNQNFVDEHPELTARLVLASALSTKYMYEHPYSAAMMFAKEFGTSEAAGLRTMYLKTNAEGRTLNWEISGENIDNLCAYQEYWGISEENRSIVTSGSDSIFDLSFLESCGIESFDTFLEEAGINEKFPVGMSYSDWLYEAEEIDGIDHSSEVGKNVEKWMDGEVITEIPLHSDSEG